MRDPVKDPVKDPRPWIALLALVCFLSGAAGAVLVQRLASREVERGPFAAYADELVREFDLGPERAVHLNVILRGYAHQIEDLRRAREAEFYASLEPDMRRVGAEYNEKIRNYVLPPSERERFDALVQGRDPSAREN